MKLSYKKLFLLIVPYLLTGSLVSSAALKTETSQTPHETQLSFIQPFNIFYSHFNLHVMLYFNGHPEYEAVEALIQLNGNEKHFIQVIMTRHDQTQIDYVNDPEIPELRQASASSREIHYTSIEFFKSDDSVFLKFASNKGENVEFHIHTAGKPTATFAGLINPEGHAKESALPVMWSVKNTLASTKSRIAIDGKSYQIPVKFKIPFFFTGLKGYYSEGFSIGVINTGKTRLEMVKTPEKIETGQEWLIKKGSLESVYQISEFGGCDFKVTDQNKLERINGIIANNRIMIKTIETMASPESEERMTVRFSPALPEPSGMSDGEKEIAGFKIDINEHRHVIQGKVEIQKERGQVIICLIPAKPKWAVKRALQIEISRENKDAFWIQSSIIH